MVGLSCSMSGFEEEMVAQPVSANMKSKADRMTRDGSTRHW